MSRAALTLVALLAACGPAPAQLVHTTPAQCLHDPSCPYLLFAAHRGRCGLVDEPENTLSAYLACARAGAPLVEVDVRVTKDNQVVLNHDSTVERTTDAATRYGGRTAVKELTLEEYKALVITDPRCTGADADPLRCHPATLDELLAATDELGLFIDYKDGPLQPFFDTVRARRAEARVLFLDSSLTVLEQVAGALPLAEIMPRISSADEARSLLATTTLPVRWLHGDPLYVKELDAELAARGVRLYANLWHLDVEFFVSATLPAEEQSRYYRANIWPRLRASIADGLDGAGTEYSGPMIRELYPDGWGNERR